MEISQISSLKESKILDLSIKKDESENILLEYAQSLFKSIEEETLNYLNKSNDFGISSKIIKNKLLVFSIVFKKKSEINQLREDLDFKILITEKFPEDIPQVYCYSNVIF